MKTVMVIALSHEPPSSLLLLLVLDGHGSDGGWEVSSATWRNKNSNAVS